MNAKTLLIFSLAANLALGVYALRPTAKPEPAPVTVVKKQDAPAPEKVVHTSTTNTLVKTVNWEMVESPDYKEYIANLRSIGCPAETIRDIIIADVTKLYDAKKKLVRGEKKKFEYWKAGFAFMPSTDPEVTKKLRALDDERDNVLRELGIEPDFKTAATAMMNPLDAMFDFLPEDKKVKMLKLFQEMQDTMMNSAKDGAPDMKAMEKAQKDMEAKVKALLTPDEYRDYSLRFSNTANIMRSQLAGFDPNEQEFLNVFDIRKKFDEDYSMYSRGDESESDRKKREDAEKTMKDQIKGVLGADRYEEYARAQDYGFQQMYRAAKQADLGSKEAAKLYDMKKAVEQKANEIRANSDLTPEARSAALEAIRTETEGSMKQVLGDKGWDSYNKPNNTWWLRNLSPPKPTATK